MALLASCRGALLASVLLLLLSSEARGDCGPPKSFPNAQIKQDVGPSSPVGTRLTYTCLPGYEPTSQIRPVTECLETSQWSEVSVSCRGRRCPVPNIEDGRIVEDSDLRLGAQITFICNEGYRPIGQNGARCVLRGGAVVWDRDPPHCQRIPCRPPPTIAHGTHNGQGEYNYGSTVTYRCDKPFSLIGSKALVCRSDQDLNGKWSEPAPECKEVNCRTPEVSNGVMQTSYQPSYTYQDKIAFSCVQGYRLKGNTGLITCGADSTWQPRLPECIPGTPPTTSTGGYVEGGTSAGPTVQSPVGSTVNPMEETTKTEIGSNVSVPAVVGAVVGVIAVVAIIVGALAYRARLKRQGKTVTGSASPESYAAVPHNADISLKERVKPRKA